MSGGSYDYLYSRLEDAASGLRARHPDAMHVHALAAHLEQIAKVMHDIEWADSGDTTWTPELAADIRALLAPGAELRIATARAKRSLHQLRDALELAKGSTSPTPIRGWCSLECDDCRKVAFGRIAKVLGLADDAEPLALADAVEEVVSQLASHRDPPR